MSMKEHLHTKDVKIQTTFRPFSYGKVTGAIFFDTRRGKKGNVYPAKYRITYQRQQKYFDSGYAFTVNKWNDLINPKAKGSDIIETREMILNGYAVIEQHIKSMVSSSEFSFDMLSKRISRGNTSSIKIAFDRKMAVLKANGQVGTAMIYDCAINSLTEFNKGRELMFSTVNVDWLRKYEKWFISGSGNEENSGNSFATASIYLRSLRAIFNEAIRSGDIPNTALPFGRGLYEMPSSPGRKMALGLDQIKKLITHKVEPGSTTEKMRDLWVFSYMANGMNVKDIVCLKWESVSNDEIRYLREKTKQTRREKKEIIVPILPEMQTIINKWGNENKKPESFLFGYLEENATPDKIRLVSQNLTRLINKHLSDIAKIIGLPHISTYTARHSFSNVLLNAGASIEFISEALGHSDISTTRAYLEGFRPDTRRKMNTNLLNFEPNE